MLSSLSIVPPEWPRPRPETIGTWAPQAATSGASIKLTLSPTPPVECLSTIGPCRRARSHCMFVPEFDIARVSATRSWMSMPLKKTAIASAAA